MLHMYFSFYFLKLAADELKSCDCVEQQNHVTSEEEVRPGEEWDDGRAACVAAAHRCVSEGPNMSRTAVCLSLNLLLLLLLLFLHVVVPIRDGGRQRWPVPYR